MQAPAPAPAPTPAPPLVWAGPKTGFHLLMGPVPGAVGIITLRPPGLQDPADPFRFMESCVAKSAVSSVMGGAMGGLMGLLLGSYQSIAPPMSIPGVPEPPKVPLRFQLRESWISTARRCRRWGRNFAMVTVVFSGVDCVIEKWRATHDLGNGVSAGCITGAALAVKQGQLVCALAVPVSRCFQQSWSPSWASCTVACNLSR